MLSDSNRTAEHVKPSPATNVAGEEGQPEIDSRFRLIVVAALRSKQLLHGSRPRIDADSLRRRNTSIALEEVRRGLVPFTITTEERKRNGDEESEADDVRR